MAGPQRGKLQERLGKREMIDLSEVAFGSAPADQGRLLEEAFNNLSLGIIVFDDRREVVFCNARYLEIYGLSAEQVKPGTPTSDLIRHRLKLGLKVEETPDDYVRERIGKPVVEHTVVQEFADGRIIRYTIRPMSNGGGMATHEDITEKRQTELKIEHMAHHDSLTGLANRVRLNDRLEEALTQPAHGRMIAVHHLDLDRFKAVNDTLGHHAGDTLLKIVASRLREQVRTSDTISRMGGDEFVIVQSAISEPSEATLLAERVIAAIAEPFEIDGHQFAVGTSVGIAVSPGDGNDSATLLTNADLALYRAKEDGRGTFRFFEAGMDEHMQTRRSMERDMRTALPAGQFELYYQPVVNLQTSAISGLEALIRWNHPQRGLISPATFIPLAEESGFIIPLGEWVIRQACLTAAKWPEHLHVAVNISASQFRSEGLMQVILGALRASGLKPTRLEIEITETVLLQGKEAMLAILHQLRALGVRIAMDDFGIGYSSLTYLQSFPFDKIKIDRSFVKDITENAGSLKIVRAVASLANGMGMTATAEGVETNEQLDRITAEGCTEMQGYLFSRPLPARDIERLFLSRQKADSASGGIVAA
jgi:diguanylate cyclase (GGDEF)-like protein/PAS domain S-box-containing protein